MQQAHIRLNELIWEITGQCKNGCSYCGSKDQWNTEIDEKMILKIGEEICKYPPQDIDISGGDPLLVNYETHETLIKMMKGVGIYCKVIINPKSFKRDVIRSNAISGKNALKLYDWVGVSVNETEEIGLFKEYMEIGFIDPLKSTVISNFNVGNVFLFDEIAKICQVKGMIWQIQYTMFEEKNGLAIYENEGGLKHLWSKIGEWLNKGVKIVLADNMNTGRCGAGMMSCGILSNGVVVPCLSMRSWRDLGEYESRAYGILDTGLEVIWTEGFKEQRFGEFKCCKDHCGNKCFDIPAITDVPKVVKSSEPITDGPFSDLNNDPFVRVDPPVNPNGPWVYPYPNPISPDSDEAFGRVVMYAVSPSIQVYGVTTYRTMAYACCDGRTYTTWQNNGGK